MKILNGWIVLLPSLLLVMGCTISSKRESFSEQNTYTVTERYSDTPLFSINGVSKDWTISAGGATRRRAVGGSYQAVTPSGSLYGGVRFSIGMSRDEDKVIREKTVHYFNFDLLVNKNYEQRSDFLKITQYNEKVRREVGYREIVIEKIQFRGLQCLMQLRARGSVSRGGYILEKDIYCPIVVHGKLGSFGFDYTINHWVAALDSLREHYGDDYLRLAFGDLEAVVQPALDSLEFHVNFSQNPDDLVGYNFPPVPDGMTYTDFYLEVIPEQFHLLSPPNVLPWNRILTPEDIVRMKSKGLTLPIAQEWKLFFENARSERESHLRSTRAPNGRVRTEEGIQISLRELTDMIRLFSETIEMWDQVPGTNE